MLRVGCRALGWRVRRRRRALVDQGVLLVARCPIDSGGLVVLLLVAHSVVLRLVVLAGASLVAVAPMVLRMVRSVAAVGRRSG